MAILEHDAFMSDELRRVPLKELTNRLDSFRRVMTERDPAWKMAVITDKIDMYYFAGTMQDGAFIIRPEDAIRWVRRSLARAKNESLLPESMLRRMHSFRQPAEFYGKDIPSVIYLDNKHTSLEWLGFFQKYFPMKQQRDLTPVLAQLRSIKSDYELELLTRAGRIHEQVLIHDVAPFPVSYTHLTLPTKLEV